MKKCKQSVYILKKAIFRAVWRVFRRYSIIILGAPKNPVRSRKNRSKSKYIITLFSCSDSSEAVKVVSLLFHLMKPKKKEVVYSSSLLSPIIRSPRNKHGASNSVAVVVIAFLIIALHLCFSA